MSDVKHQILDLEIDKKVKSSSSSIIQGLCSIQLLSMIAVTAHHTAMPFFVQMANTSHFLPTTSVFMMEVLKLLFCLIIVLFKTKSFEKTGKKLYEHIWKNRVETLKVSVPAVVYAIQNNLYYIALANIDATTYSVTVQLRILTTALLSVIILNQKLSNYQWLAQGMALIGVVLVQIDNSNPHGKVFGNFWLGITAVFGMCWTSGFAGVYFEKMLKESSADVWVQNIRLSTLTLLFAGITMLSTDGEAVLTGKMFFGWNWIVWFVTIGNSIVGLCISLVMKYADNVMKTYCQSLAIGLTAIVSIFLGDRTLSIDLIYGVLLVTSSIVVYSRFPATTSTKYEPLEQDSDAEKN